MIDRERDAPDLEDLAAYVDGGLSAGRKARVEERLVRDEDYYDVFLENVRFLQEQEQASSGGGEVVAPAAWRRSLRVIVPAAVAAALAVALGLALRGGSSTRDWVARIDPAAVVAHEEDWDIPGWSARRSGEPDYSYLRSSQLAFRLGVRTVDLQIALRGRDEDAAQLSAAQLAGLTGADETLFYLRPYYQQLQEKIDDGAFKELTTEAAEYEALLREGLEGSPEAEYLALGAWTEAGRLAALSGNAELLSEIVRDRRLAESTAEIAPQVQRLENLLERPALEEETFEAAGEAFRAIAESLAG